jgi:hypothetical protein
MKLNGKPVVDATDDLHFLTKPRDCRGAVPLDPHNCVIARGVKRMLNGDVKGVQVHKSVTYVDVGTHYVRYLNTAEMKAMVHGYDLAGFFPASVPVRLRAPKASEKLDAQPRSRNGSKRKDATPRLKRPWLRPSPIQL